MAIWEIRPIPDLYHSLQLADDALEYSQIAELFRTGEPLASMWKPIPVDIYEASLDGDFPSLFAGTPPVFSERALTVLLPLISYTIEALPLKSSSGMYFVVNPQVIDCLDHVESEYERFQSSGKIRRITKYVFHTERIANRHIFRIPEQVVSRTFVTTSFKELVEQNDLLGLQFLKVA